MLATGFKKYARSVRMRRALAVAALIAGALWLAVPAQANMLIMPTRVYFVDGERMKTLTVLNDGAEQAVFRIQMQYKRQLPEGGYESISAPLNPGYDPASWLVYSPRQVSLDGQAKQSIRLSLRRPAELPDGEYRVHMALDRTARESIERRQGDAGKLSPQMFLNVGFAVPVIIRKGANDAKAEIKNYSLLPADVQAGDTRPRLMVDITRSGKYSTVGEVAAYWTAAGSTEEVLVGQQKGIVIYPEVASRSIRVFLNQQIHGGKLRVVYTGSEVDRGKTFDEKIFTLQ